MGFCREHKGGKSISGWVRDHNGSPRNHEGNGKGEKQEKAIHRNRPKEDTSAMAGRSEEPIVLTRIKGWRQQHPRATLRKRRSNG
jgi:hypothetical protein